VTDRRLTPFSGRIALESLRGQVTPEAFVPGEPARIGAALAELALEPGGGRERQLLHGAEVLVIERRGAAAFVQARLDGACGWGATAALAPLGPPTHLVVSRGTHLYREASIKRGEVMALSLGARVAVRDTEGPLARTPEGFVPRAHLRPLGQPEPDPVAVAERLLGTPYLWGGNTAQGIDCSGLVQLAFTLAGRACPADSDQQSAAFGPFLPEHTPPERGDLLFWVGHVALLADPQTLIHANGHTMSVAFEPLAAGRARIEAAGASRYFGRKRPGVAP
jgi:cell wall-associated NlpC family hydrolase